MSKQSKIFINIVTWNSGRDIKNCLTAVFNQRDVDFDVLIIDNASTDDTIKIVTTFFGRQFNLVKNNQNLGFAGAHNLGIDFARRRGAEYVLALNPDVTLTPNFLAELASFIKHHQTAASVSGTLLNAFNPKLVDSTGLRLLRSRQVVERHAQSPLSAVNQTPVEVFGVSGAAALYRLSALTSIALNNEFFDEDFFAYKEDADLAWRLRLRGWSAWHVPSATATHRRAVARQSQRRQRGLLINRLSYKNQLLMIIKNEQSANFWRDGFFIIGFELAKLFYLLWREPLTLVSLKDFARQLPRTIVKRRENLSVNASSPKMIRLWISPLSS